MPYKLVGITGKAGAGKDALASQLVIEFRYTKLQFAFYLKRMLAALPFFEQPNWEDGNWKAKKHPFYKQEPRKFAQTLGTEWGRQCIDEDLWLKLASYQISSKAAVLDAKAFVFTDMRFENEAKFIRNQDGLVVHILRPEQPYDKKTYAHSSESGIAISSQDMVIENTGSLQDLQLKAARIDKRADAYSCKSF